MAIPAGITAQDVKDAAVAWDAGEYRRLYGEPTGYYVVIDGRYYPPKAMIGIAAKRLLGGPLARALFSGGDAPGQANAVLENLGFEIVRKAGVRGEEWTPHEIREIVEDYLSMLAKELAGASYSKSGHRKRLLPKLPARNEPSIEFKHANISAVLHDAGLPFIQGYKPRGNYQRLLEETVADQLERSPALVQALGKPPSPSGEPPVLPFESILAPPPSGSPKAQAPRLRASVGRIALLDSQNAELGEAGERYVMELERARLTRLGRSDLASRVEWVAKTLGDGLGYDVLSFEDCGGPRRIEVKTTKGAHGQPFYLTSNELQASAELGETFWLYRLFDYGKCPKLYLIRGSLAEQLRLTPTQYRAESCCPVPSPGSPEGQCVQ